MAAVKHRLKEILMNNSTSIQYIGILDQEGNEVVGVSQVANRDIIKEKSYHFVYKIVRSNFSKTCNESLKSVFLGFDKNVINLCSLAKDHTLFILLDKSFENMALLVDIEKSIRNEYEQQHSNAQPKTAGMQ